MSFLEAVCFEDLTTTLVAALGPAAALQLRCASGTLRGILCHDTLQFAAAAWKSPHTSGLRLSDRICTAKEGELADLIAAEVLLATPQEVSAPNEYGQTALMWAAGRGHAPLCALLLEAGAEIEAVDSSGWSALFHGAWHGQCHAVAVLLRAQANVNVLSSAGVKYTPLMAAARFGHVRVVQQLMAAKAETSVKTPFGETAASLAREQRHHGVVQLLGGADMGVGLGSHHSRHAPNYHRWRARTDFELAVASHSCFVNS
mmetsp:Transcript_6298/g.10614  ORF Transcript_6298/g.10614 Transcript_6298/m.10614 type:complete len:259 (+) Transcript_6298:27-803(+)